MKTKSKKDTQLYRLDSQYPMAGRFQEHTLKEWKRIYGYTPETMFTGKLIQVGRIGDKKS